MCFRVELATRAAALRLQLTAAVRALCLVGLLAAVGCFADHPCSQELCDDRDNDCDGRVDENFKTPGGLFVNNAHCGACGIACSDVYPSAAATQCVLSQGAPRCEITRCPAGEVPAGDGACIPAPSALCLPCAEDSECSVRSVDARCLPEPEGAGRCGQACARAEDCPSGFRCTQVGSGKPQCRPLAGSCTCNESMLGADFACELTIKSAGQRRVCAGMRRCTTSGLSACEAALHESCNGLDDDCDGSNDEDFKDAAGRYVSALHCGSCGRPCVAPGPHMVAQCVSGGTSVACRFDCEAGFVDTDELAADGCECQLVPDRTPRIGGDGDCDGEIDPIPELVFVSQGGDDANSGTSPDAPLRSLTRGMQLGASLRRSVLVARGIYQGPIALVSGATLVGGYSPDFRSHDVELYPVMIEADENASGVPVLTCKGITDATYVEGLTLVAADGHDASQGSTALLLDGCGPLVELHAIEVLAGRGGAGSRGADSSDRLKALGFGALSDLAGVSGGVGAGGATSCLDVVAAGGGGGKLCGGLDVAGGAGGSARCASLSCDNAMDVPCGNAGCSDFTVKGVCDIEAARRAAVANPAPQPGRGPQPGAAAELTYDAPTNHGVCSFCDDNPSLPRAGGDGGDGRAGATGDGGGACSPALALDADGRARAGAGVAGSAGSPGSGGGGGSAGSGYAVIAATRGSCLSVPGAAGGGGGSGGCGAPGAAGGGGGGASIGILIRLANGLREGPKLSELRVVTASGGDGGDGGVGASGGVGGAGGVGGSTDFWCARNGGRGGDGGPGGAGGGGGGGCGGASLGVYLIAGNAGATNAYVNALSTGVRVEIAGAPGRGGAGGFSPGHPGTTGSDGMAVASMLSRP